MAIVYVYLFMASAQYLKITSKPNFVSKNVCLAIVYVSCMAFAQYLTVTSKPNCMSKKAENVCLAIVYMYIPIFYYRTGGIKKTLLCFDIIKFIIFYCYQIHQDVIPKLEQYNYGWLYVDILQRVSVGHRWRSGQNSLPKPYMYCTYNFSKQST